jgi:ElaB/YqjD/DUF883 family membrane-anchored ribosome-binding protein
MEHPLIPNLDDLTLDQLQEKITELNRKLAMASRMGNAQLRQQVQMALESYQNKFREKQQKIWDDARKKGTDYSDRINIS